MHESPRRVHLRPRAVCGVAHARSSYGYRCVLRLAAHRDTQRTFAARFAQGIPRYAIICRDLGHELRRVRTAC